MVLIKVRHLDLVVYATVKVTFEVGYSYNRLQILVFWGLNDSQWPHLESCVWTTNSYIISHCELVIPSTRLQTGWKWHLESVVFEQPTPNVSYLFYIFFLVQFTSRMTRSWSVTKKDYKYPVTNRKLIPIQMLTRLKYTREFDTKIYLYYCQKFS